MQDTKKHILRVFVPHRSFSGRPSLEQAYDALKEEVDKINGEGLQKHLIELELQDFEKERGLSNPSSSTFQSAETLVKDAESAHAVFTLVDGDMTAKFKDWYCRQIRRVMREKDEDKVPMPIFWKTAGPDSLENYKEFCDEFKDDCDYIETYETVEQFREKAAHWLEELSFRWAARITRGQEVPTLASNRRRRSRKWFLIGLILALLGAGFCFLWPYLKGMREKSVFGKRIDDTEQLVIGQQFESARDSLISLNEACKPDWAVERARIDSLATIVERYFVGVGIDAAEKKIHLQQFDAAKASLDSLLAVCKGGWNEEITLIDSLKHVIQNSVVFRTTGEPIIPAKPVTRTKNSVYINVDARTYETNYNDQLKSIIEGRLIRQGYSPVANRNAAQYEIKVSGRPTDATALHIIHLDVIIRVTNLETGKLIYSNKNTYKDGSNSDEAAAMKIYRQIVDAIGQEVSICFTNPGL